MKKITPPRRTRGRPPRSQPCPTRKNIPSSAKGCRVQGIYEESGKFRVVAWLPQRTSIWCQSREEAEQTRAGLERRIQMQASRTIRTAFEEYKEAQLRNGHKAVTLYTINYRIGRFLPLDRHLHEVTEEFAAKLYAAETERISRIGRPLSASAHRATLKSAKAFFRWIVEDRKYLDANPFARVKPVGRVNVGKRQLRIDEARTLTEFLIKCGESGDPCATASLTQLLLGLRSSEVLARRVRDIDDHGRLFCVDGGKTRNARRWLRIECEPLQRLLLRQTRGKQPEELLFDNWKNIPYHPNYLWKGLRKYCRLAGVPVVCPHSLRGLHSTIAIEQGATSGVVAAALGHSSFAVTARHYVEPGRLASVQQRKVTQTLTAGPESTADTPQEALEALRRLSPEALAALLQTIRKPH